MVLSTYHATLLSKLAHCQKCMCMQDVLCSVIKRMKLILWSWQRRFNAGAHIYVLLVDFPVLCLDVVGKTRFLAVHILYIANDYTLSLLL